MFSFLFTDAIFEMGAQGIFLSNVVVRKQDSKANHLWSQEQIILDIKLKDKNSVSILNWTVVIVID